MSLQTLAQHVQNAGRNDDKMLVHMTPREVGGLQALAMANGGSLTINPETGLPEAGFLDRLMPTIIGAGLMMIPGMQPLGAAALTGAGYGIATGSLEKGLMAGLGAYGGAGLTAGLNTMGAAAAGTSAGAAGASAIPAATNAASLQAAQAAAAGNTAAAAGAGAGGAGGATLGNIFKGGSEAFTSTKGFGGLMDHMGNIAPYSKLGLGMGLMGAMTPDYKPPASNPGMIRPYTYERSQRPEAYAKGPNDSSEAVYFNEAYYPGTPYRAANGGIVALAPGGTIEEMSRQNAIGDAPMYPQQQVQSLNSYYSDPRLQNPFSNNVIKPATDVKVDQFTGEQRLAVGGEAHLGDYSDGGRLLRGPGDGVSDSIPASIGGNRPARLADGEFVVPARIVSEIGNGSTEAGARKLYAMMDRVQKARRKSVGKGKVAVDSKAEKLLPA